MKFELDKFNRNIQDQELLDDLKRVANEIETRKLSSREYNKNGGKFTAGTICVRFGGWNNAIEKADLEVVHQRDVPKEELFKNIEEVWRKLGRQPVFRDIKEPLSKYSTHPALIHPSLLCA